MDPVVEWAIHHFQREVGVITGAPVLAFAFFALAFLLAWFIQGKLHDSRHEASASTVGTKVAHIEFLEGQLAEYKSKLSGATPAEAAAQIEELRDEVRVSRAEVKALLEWADYQSSDRRLSADQIKILADHLKSLPPDVQAQLVVTSVNMPEPQQYALDIHNAFEAAGLNVKFEPMTNMQITSPDEVGVLLIVSDDKNPPPFTAQIRDAFNAAGVEANYDQCDPPWIGCTVMVSYKPPMRRGGLKVVKSDSLQL